MDSEEVSMSEDEAKQYFRIMGIEQARDNDMPMPEGVTIPRRFRERREGCRCGKCNKEVAVGYEDGHGMWHYRCPECVKNQDPNGSNPCPRCKCTAHENIATDKTDNNPFAPDVAMLRCLNCCLEYPAVEYERYLLTRTVRSVTDKSPFHKSDKQ